MRFGSLTGIDSPKTGHRRHSPEEPPQYPALHLRAAVVTIGLLLPFTPLLGLYYLFLAAMVVAYLKLLELVKRPVMNIQ